MIPALNESRVWFITGASSGFGREITLAALGRGDRVVAAAPNVSRLGAELDQWEDVGRATAIS